MKLIATIEEVQKHIPVNMTSDIDTVGPFLSNAERVHVLQLIGKEQYTALEEAYKAAELNLDQVEDDIIREALFICQKIISNLGYYQAVPVLSVSVGTSGIQVHSNEQTKQAFQWQVEELKNSLLELGFSAIEELLVFLEESPDKFTEYINSEQFAKTESLLIRNAAEFSECFNIDGSRYIFQSVSYLIKRVEDQVIGKLYGAVFLNGLKSEDSQGNRGILANEYLKPGIALFTIAKALIERIITLEKGRVVINFKGTYNNMKESMVPDRELVQTMSEQLIRDANDFLQSGLEFIADNPADFPDFLSPQPRRRFRFTNDKSKGVFGI